MQQAGQQAGIAGQIQAQQLAEQQQKARDPQAVAQMAAQMVQGQGIAGLPAQNMQFREGGVVGFDRGGPAPMGIPMPTAPEFEGAMAQAEKYAPQVAAQQEELRQIAKDRQAAIDSAPNLTQEGIAAIQQAAAEREALMRERAEGQGLRKFMAAMRDVRTHGNAYEGLEDQIFARAEAGQKAKLADAQMILKLKEIEQADKLKQFDRKEALIKDLHALDKYKQKSLEDLGKDAATMAYHNFGTKRACLTKP
jgi:hypothetical protein